MIFKILKSFWVLGVLSFSVVSLRAEVPKIVVSIPPLGTLVRAIAGESVAIEVLVKDGISPHFYTLRPSDRQKIDQASILMWIGPVYEGFLSKVMENYSAKNVALITSPQLHLYPLRSRNCCEGNHHHHHDLEMREIDGHIWLDPDNGYFLASAITYHLSQLNPDLQQTYEQNLKDLRHCLDVLKKELKILLEPYKDEKFLVYHDGYQYFEKAFDLTGGRSTNTIPDIAPSAKSIQSLKEFVEQHQVHCLLAETQFSPRLLQTIAQDHHLEIGLLDPLGSVNLSYEALLRNIGNSLAQCLKGSS